MTSGYFMMLRRLLCATVFLLALAAPTNARVIGILFDDSGSMRPRIHLPTFGAQLLASTLDGRPGNDRLFTIRLSQALTMLGSRGKIVNVPPGGVNADNVAQWIAQAPDVVTVERLGSPAEHQATLDHIRTAWPFASVDTPYEPLEIILHKLTSEVPEDGEAVLVVLTDGDFDPKPPGPARARASFERYAERLAAKRATLRVEFLLIAPSDPAMIEAVRAQGIRDALLQTFNGNPSTGSFEVTDLNRLNEALKDVIADVAATDRRKQGQYISGSSNSVVIDTPLSLRRIVSVSSGLATQPLPRLQTPPAGTLDRRQMNTWMEKADEAPAIAGQRLAGITDQMYFEPALQPGQHALTYDRALDGKVFLLFQTGAYVDLQVLKADGQLADRDGNGFLLYRNAPYQLEAVLMDRSGGSPTRVRLSTLRGESRFTGTIRGAAGSASVPLTTDLATNRIVGPFTLAERGTALAQAEAHLEGFVSLPSRSVSLRVVESAVTLDAQLRRIETCSECGAGEFRGSLDRAGQAKPFAMLEVTPHGVAAGAARLDLSRLPPMISLGRQGGPAINTGEEIQFTDGRTIQFEVRSDGRTVPAGGRAAFEISILPQAPLTGRADVSGTLVVDVPTAVFDMRLVPAEACPTCREGQIQATIDPRKRGYTPAHVEVVPHLERPATAAVDLKGLPPGLTIALPGRSALRQGEELAVRDGVPFMLELRTDVSSLPQSVRQPFRIGLTAIAPSAGAGEVAGEILYTIPPARLTYVGAGGIVPPERPRLSGSQLTKSSLPLDFVLESALTDPQPADVSVSGGTSRITHTVTVDRTTVHVTAGTSGWCICILPILAPKQSITVEWRHPSGLQSARSMAEYDVVPGGLEILWSCGALSLWLLLLIWIALAIMTMLRTQRFPRGSVAELIEGRQLPRNVDLRHANWTLVRSFMPWHALRLRPPHERTTIEGIVLEAAPNGATILMKSTSVDFLVVHLGQNSRDLRETNPNIDRISVMWNSEIERDVGVLLTIKLLRKMNDQFGS